MRTLPRREFLEDTAALAASMAMIPGLASADTPKTGEADTKPASANDTLRVAVCGVRSRGMEHIEGWNKLNDVRITAICDVDLNVTGPARKAIAKRNGTEPPVVQDIRRLLDDKSIDAISIATPNHWHALATIWACQAGKDVYVEKPVSHNVSEGRRMVEAARKFERIVQTGTQCRSHQGIQDAIAFLRSGKLGQIYMAKGLCYKSRGSIGHKADTAVPADVDYNIWLGPAPERPFNPNRFHYNFRWFWDYAGGLMTDWGVHLINMMLMGTGPDAPKTAFSSGGKFVFDDNSETPDSQVTVYEFPGYMLIWEHKAGLNNGLYGRSWGIEWSGTEGNIILNDSGYELITEPKRANL